MQYRLVVRFKGNGRSSWQVQRSCNEGECPGNVPAEMLFNYEHGTLLKGRTIESVSLCGDNM